MHLSSPAIQAKTKAVALALMLVALWLLIRGYHGLSGDGQIYAFQALARIHPQLATDLYLQNTSQDQFTIFSPLYAWVIGNLGLADAARLLSVLFTAWLFAAAWSLVRTIAGRDAAWLAAALLLIVAGDYGGSGVFRLSEQFMTARLPAEALIVTALACHVQGRKRFALLLATGALLVHPLIALPGLIFLLCMGSAVPRERFGCHRGGVGDSCHGGRRDPAAGGLSRIDRHGRGLAASRAGTLAISVLAAMVGSRLGRKHAAIHLFGVHRDGRTGLADSQTLPGSGARGSLRIGGGAHRQPHRPGRHPGPGSGMAMGVDYRVHQRRAASRHRIASVARREMRSTVRDIAGVGLDLGTRRWNGLCLACIGIVGSANAYQRSRSSLLAMAVCGAWHRHPDVDTDQILDDPPASDSSNRTRTAWRGADSRTSSD